MSEDTLSDMLQQKKRKILALIPARSGSKSIPDKNIRLISGKPMLAWSIGHALASELIDRVIVSTDSPKYAAIAQKYGAEVPFIRPESISGDLSTDLEVFVHALEFLRGTDDPYIPEYCVHLRPTYPVRPEGLIDSMIHLLDLNPEADSIRSVAPAEHTPFKMWFMDNSGYLTPVVNQPGTEEAWNMPRQSLPAVYLQNACVDIVRSEVIMHQRSMTGRKIVGYPMEHMYDIDYMSDLIKVKKAMKKK